MRAGAHAGSRLGRRIAVDANLAGHDQRPRLGARQAGGLGNERVEPASIMAAFTLIHHARSVID
jgi:hypothetical protein